MPQKSAKTSKIVIFEIYVTSERVELEPSMKAPEKALSEPLLTYNIKEYTSKVQVQIRASTCTWSKSGTYVHVLKSPNFHVSTKVQVHEKLSFSGQVQVKKYKIPQVHSKVHVFYRKIPSTCEITSRISKFSPNKGEIIFLPSDQKPRSSKIRELFTNF